MVPGVCLFLAGDPGYLSCMLCYLEQAPSLLAHNCSESPEADWLGSDCGLLVEPGMELGSQENLDD